MTQAFVTIDPAAGIYTAVIALPDLAIGWIRAGAADDLLSKVADRLGWRFIGYFDVVHDNAVSELRGIEE